MLSIKSSYVFSVIVQFILLLFLAYHIDMRLPKKLGVLHEAFRFEYYVSILEFLGYLLIGYMIVKKKTITVYRYGDWFITTTMLLISLCYLFLYRQYKKQDKTEELTNDYIVKTYQKPLQTILVSNFFMLLFGFLGELKKIPYFLGYVVGMICFIITFSTIFNNFAKGQAQNEQLFGVFMIVWLLYGIAYLMSYKTKNIAYNLLDLVSKNIFGLYLFYIIQQEKIIN
tara:strand:- start:17 stop:697 length:681 start_codon:yes stop_codon:yes gene_type:complete